MSLKRKIAEIIATRDELPVECVIDQLNLMVEEMQEIADTDDLGAFAPDLEFLWTDWTGLEPDYFIEFVLENL